MVVWIRNFKHYMIKLEVSMLIDSGIQLPTREQLWAESGSTAEPIDGHLVRSKGITENEIFLGKE